MPQPAGGFPAPGDRIGPYRIVRRIGAGGMGVVFEALDTVLHRRIALKVISPPYAGDPAFRVRFAEEARTQASLDSPHVVPVFAHGEADGALYIASQLVPDGDLGAMIRAQGVPPPRVALDLIAQVAAGLADAHAAGVVHGDLKPANVLLRFRCEEASAYLADFGIARRAGVDPPPDRTLPAQGVPVGTPTAMAPELHAGGSPGTTTDVYALGCLLWTALVGRAPYTGSTDDQVAHAHVAAPVPQLEAGGPFEREVNRILRTAMAKRPRERYPSAAALRADLRRVLRAHPAPSAVRAGSARQRRRVGPALVLLVGVTVVGVVGAVALFGDDGGRGAADQHGMTPDERAAARNIAAALTADSGFDVREAACTARKLVRRSGIDGLHEQGVLDDDLDFVADADPAVDPQILSAVISLGASCVFEFPAADAQPSS